MQTTLANLERLKLIAVVGAQTALNRERPEYVATFRTTLVDQQSPKRAEEAAKRHLRGFKKWPLVLTAAFDLQIGIERLEQCLGFLQAATTAESEAGKIWVYHFEYWVIRADATLDRCWNLAEGLLESWPAEPFVERAAALKSTYSDIRAAKKPIARHRQNLVHGLGGGVDGIIGRWPPFLALPDPRAAFAGFTGATVETLAGATLEQRKGWLENVQTGHGQVLHNVNYICGSVADLLDANPLE